jgi:LPS sulfotransferase NodH
MVDDGSKPICEQLPASSSGHPTCRVCAIAPIRTPAGSRLIQIGVYHLMPSPIRFRPLVTRFAILFVERAGSTYLATALATHPEILALREQFVRLREQGMTPAEQLAWARQFWTPPLIGQHAAIGFKTKTMDIPDPDGFGQLLDEKQVKVIQLMRRNTVKGAISTINARQLHAASGGWNLHKEADRQPPAPIDPEDLQREITLREEWDNELVDYVNSLGRPTLQLYYEELLRDETAFMGRVFDFLNVTPMAVKGKTLKNTSDDLRQAVPNFDALRARYIGTRYEAMFDEVMVLHTEVSR